MEIRKLVKLAKAKNDDIFYRDFADYLNISRNGFYNWLKGYYDLSNSKAEKLLEVVIELAMD